MYIEALSELGILGFGCLFFLLLYTFKDGLYTYNLLKAHDRDASFLNIANSGAIVGLFAYCVGGMFETLLTYPMFYILIAIIVLIKSMAIKSCDEVN